MGRRVLGVATLALSFAAAAALPAAASVDAGRSVNGSRSVNASRSLDAGRVIDAAGPTDAGGVETGPAAPARVPAEDPIVGVRPEALVTTGTVLALVMGATGVVTAVRARRRARE